jgi:hypothetical protein
MVAVNTLRVAAAELQMTRSVTPELGPHFLGTGPGGTNCG